MYESLAGDPLYAARIKEMRGNFYERPNRVSIIGLIENPLDEKLHVADVAGGANIVSPRAAHQNHRPRHGQERRAGRVITVDDGKPVDRGNVVVTVQPDGKARVEMSRSGKVFNDGRFTIELNLQREDERHGVLKAKGLRMQAHYLGALMLADCNSEVVWAKP